jgi:hypothetical protein
MEAMNDSIDLTISNEDVFPARNPDFTVTHSVLKAAVML